MKKIDRWLMFKLCLEYGIGWLGIIHDFSRYFGKERKTYHHPGGVKYRHLHYRHNKHHWQYWVLIDADGTTPLDMPLRYRKEMLCRWLVNAGGDGIKVGDWYLSNKSKMILHENTREWIEAELFWDR